MGTWKWFGTFDAADLRWKRLIDWQTSQGQEPFVVDRIEYSSTELNTSKFLQFYFNVELKGEIGPSQGTQYDLNGACPYCKSGATVIPPFYIKPNALPKKRIIAATFQNVSLVSGCLLDELQSRPSSPNWLVPVADSKTKTPLSWAAILPQAILPRMDKSTKGFYRDKDVWEKGWGVCPECEQDCCGSSHNEPFQPVYSRSQIQKACKPFLFFDQEFPDAAATWERTFPGARPTAPDKVSTPLVFVNQEVYQILRKHAGKYLRATPAILVD